MEVGTSRTAGAVKMSDHGNNSRSGVKKWGHRDVEENELAQGGSSSKCPRAGEPWGKPRGAGEGSKARRGGCQERKPIIGKFGNHKPQ